MQVSRLRARAGSAWVREGFRLLRAGPIPLIVITMGYMLLLFLSMAIPVVGNFAPLVLTPVLSVGLMHAVRAIDRKQPVTPAMLFNGFRDGAGQAWKSLLILGVVNAIATLAALGASALFDGGVVKDIAIGQIDESDPRLQDTNLLWSVLTFLFLYTPVQMSLWYSPLFVAWHGLSPAKALFFSLIAVARNKWAFVNYLITWMLVAVAISAVVQLLSAVLSGTPTMLSLALMPISLVMITAFYCSFWPGYRDVIRDEPTRNMQE